MNEYTTELALRYKCEYCTAGPGFWCRTIRGAKATMLHSERTEGIRLAWLDGWDEGKEEGKHRLLREQERERFPVITASTSPGGSITMDAS